MKFEPRVPQPPSGWTGTDRSWAQRVADYLNRTPTVSYFSADDPNSRLTGWPGDLAVNLASGDTQMRVWQKRGLYYSVWSWYPFGAGGGIAASEITSVAVAETVVEYSYFEGDDEHQYEFTNLPSAESEVAPIWRDIIQMRSYKEARLVGRIRASQSGSTVVCKWSADKGATWNYLDGISGPQLSMSTVTDLAGRWVSLTSSAQSDHLVGMFALGGDGSGDPRLAKLKLQFTTRGNDIPVPPDFPQPGPGGVNSVVTSTCVVTDTYPVSRGLIAWHLADCGEYILIATPRYGVRALRDLSGSGNTLNPGMDHTISGAIVSKGERAEDGTAIAPLNGRDVIHFRDAWLPWQTSLMSGMTQGEVFIVVKGDNRDPAYLDDRYHSWRLGPSEHDAHWAEPPFLNAWSVATSSGSGLLKEDFGTQSVRSIGNPPGSLADWRIYNVRAASDEWAVAFEGSTIYVDTTNNVSFSTQPRLGARGNNSDFLMAEFALHNVKLTAAERSAVVTKLRERWGL